MRSTPATDVLDEAGVTYRVVEYGRVASAEEAAQARGVPLDTLVKTLVVRVEEGSYVLVLIPGDGGLDYKKLRTHLSVRRLTLPSPEEAKEATGYARGTITPFGAGEWPVIMDRRLAGRPELSIGAGLHGVALHLSAEDVLAVTGATVADVSQD